VDVSSLDCSALGFNFAETNSAAAVTHALSQGPPASLVFLDIDGVLLPIGSTHQFPRSCLDALAKIIKATKAVLVLSSTWRSVQEGQSNIIQQFVAHGPVLGNNLHTIGIGGGKFALTTALDMHSERQWEIADFLRSCRVPIRSWVCLDDEELLIGQQNSKYFKAFEGHVVKTDSHVGLTDGDADHAIAILDGISDIEGQTAAPPRRGRHDRKPGKRGAPPPGGWTRGAVPV
jgi:hypothetical protein